MKEGQVPIGRKPRRKKRVTRDGWYADRIEGAESVIEAAEAAFDLLRSEIKKADPADAERIRNRVSRDLTDLAKWVGKLSASERRSA